MNEDMRDREQARCAIPHCGWIAHTRLRRNDETTVACTTHTAVFEAMGFTVTHYNPTDAKQATA